MTRDASAAGRRAREDLDELCALIELTLELLSAGSRYRPWLERIRRDLDDVAADLAAGPQAEPRIQSDRIAWLAAAYAEASDALPPGAPRRGAPSEASVCLFFARSVARDEARAARAAALPPRSALALDYLDGLADVLLALARAVDTDTGEPLRPRLSPADLARTVLRIRPRTAPVPAA